MGMATISPRLIEYGKLSDTKNSLNTCSFLGSLVSAKPVIGSIEKPVINHEVMVSGTFLWIVCSPLKLDDLDRFGKNDKIKIKMFEQNKIISTFEATYAKKN